MGEEDEGDNAGGEFSPNGRRQPRRPGVKPSKVGNTRPGVVAGDHIVYGFGFAITIVKILQDFGRKPELPN